MGLLGNTFCIIVNSSTTTKIKITMSFWGPSFVVQHINEIKHLDGCLMSLFLLGSSPI